MTNWRRDLTLILLLLALAAGIAWLVADPNPCTSAPEGSIARTFNCQ